MLLGVRDTGLGRRRGAKDPRDQCHHWAWIVTNQCVTKPSILLTEAEDLYAAADCCAVVLAFQRIKVAVSELMDPDVVPEREAACGNPNLSLNHAA